MKKLLLAVITVFGLTSALAQDFKGGITVGLPLGDVQDSYILNVAVELNYIWQVSDQFHAGIATGYSHFLGDSEDLGAFGTVDVEDAGFIPITGAARYDVNEDFTLGVDLGYAVGISPDSIDGGFYYAPKAQYGVSEMIDIVLSFKGISVDGGTFSSINLGIEFDL